MAMPKTRINLRPLITALFVGVIVPISIAIFVDIRLGTLPIATIAALILFMPLGAIWLSRVSLNEFDRVIDEVAPELPESEDAFR